MDNAGFVPVNNNRRDRNISDNRRGFHNWNMDNSASQPVDNHRGFHDGNQLICKELLTIAGNKIPIICNQENFLLKANKFKVEQCLPDYHIYFIPANKEKLTGRPSNGMFIAIPKYLKSKVTEVSSLSSRLQAVILKTECRNMLIMNTYFP